MSRVQSFKKMHQQGNMLHIGNVWDVQSALLFEHKGYKALGTSSAAIADTLGYDDGEQIPFDELFRIVQAIMKVISIPLSVDIEAGYSRDEQCIIEHIIRLSDIGVVGVNIEDSIVDSHNHRHLVDSSHFSQTIKAIKQGLARSGVDLFLNVRTDGFILGLDNPLDETLARAMLYEESGADGLFAPCIVAQQDIQQLVASLSIPVNVMAMPQLPDFLTLEVLGVRRVSAGSFIYQKIKKQCEQSIACLEKDQSFHALF